MMVLSGYPTFHDNVSMKHTLTYRGYRFPPGIISHAVWLYHRFTLSLRDVEDLLAERGITVSYETIRQWWATFGRITRGEYGRLTDHVVIVGFSMKVLCRFKANVGTFGVP